MFKKKTFLLFLILIYTFKVYSKEINDIYNRPYSFSENQINFSGIVNNVELILGASLLGASILYLMPESVTNWDKDDLKNGNIFKKWKNNVKDGPVIDKDDWFLNWITHPYWGAVYYMSARSNGANAIYSFAFSVFASTFIWEYGIEAFAEVPSKQDLIITPIVGSIIGEGFYLSKRYIINNDYKLLNSKILAHTVNFIMDPITEVVSLFIKDKKENKDISIFSFPSFNKNKFTYNVYVSMNF